MARRSDHTRDELKTMAITAGQRLVAVEGFSKFSARKVAREIGYTVGTLYNVFDSHEELILYINAATLDDMRDYIAQRMENRWQDMPALKNLAIFYINFANEHYNRWNALFEFNLPQGTPLPDWYAGKIKELFLLVEVPLKPLLGGDDDKAKRASKVLWAGIHGICHLGLTGKLDTVGAEPVQVMTEAMIENFIKGTLS